MYPRHLTSGLEDPYFGGTRSAGLALIVSVLAVHAALKAVFFSSAFLRDIAIPFERWTGGVVTPSTLAGLLEWMVLVGVLMMLFGRMRMPDLGLRGEGWKTLLMGALLWISAHVLVLIAAHFAGRDVAVMPVRTASTVGALLEAVVGSAAIEEVIYRGFLFVQVYLVAKSLGRFSSSTALGLSLIGVQGYFAVNHIPSALRMGLEPVMTMLYLIEVGLVGIVLALLLVRTRSLAVPIGAHALLNAPVMLVGGPVDVGLVLLIMVCVIFLIITLRNVNRASELVPSAMPTNSIRIP